MVRQNRNHDCRISEFLIGSVPALALENSFFRIGILAGKGGDIYEFLHKETDTDIMYRSKAGLDLLRKPRVSKEGSGGVFWENFIGGWFEMLPNAGNACTNQGAEVGTHGEVMMLPWQYVIETDEPETVRVRLTTEGIRFPLLVEKVFSITKDRGLLTIQEKVTNMSCVDIQFMWGQHITMGEAFLNENCLIELPSATIIQKPQYYCSGSRLAKEGKGPIAAMPDLEGRPVDMRRIPPKGSGITETLFVEFVDDCWFRVTDQKKNLSFKVLWDKMTFPSMWIWQEFNYTKEYPFFGDCYAMALEPMSGNTPVLSEAAKDGTCLCLKAGESKMTCITAELSREEIC